MLILIIATGAFIVGGGLILASNMAPQKPKRYWW